MYSNICVERRGRVVNILPQIRDVPGSNLGHDTDYLNEGFVVLVTPQMDTGIVPSFQTLS